MKSMRLGATLILSMMTVASVRLTAQGNVPPQVVPPVTGPASSTAAASPTVPAASGPMIQMTSPNYDFGKASLGEKVRHTYVITNTGDETLHITRVQPGCHCTTVGNWTTNIAPGQGGEITVQFDSAGTGGGPVTKTITVFSNAKNEPHATLMLRGTVWRAIDVVPSTAIISIAPDVTNAVTTKVLLINQTGKPVTISHPISANRLFTAELKEITPDERYELIITAAPPFTAGNSWGTVTVNTSLPGTPIINVSVMANVVPPIQIYPPQIVLNLLPDRWTTNRITIRSNTKLIALSNPKASDSRIHVEVQPMGSGGMFSLLVSFPPGFQLESGKNAEVTVESNHPRFPLIKIPIKQYNRPKPVAAWPAHPNSQAVGSPSPVHSNLPQGSAQQ